MPALLPTPPRSKMLPLLSTPCLSIPPASFRTPSPSDPKPCRADSVERWDARKNGGSAVSSSSSSARSAIPSRADSCERWDAHKKAASSRASSGSPGRADSCERWAAHKTPGSPALSIGSNGNLHRCRADSVERWDSKRRPLSRASSSERWDINKKPRPEEDALGSGKSNSTNHTKTRMTTSEKMIRKPQIDATMVKVPPPLPFSGPAFFSSPDPAMLPMPTFLLAR